MTAAIKANMPVFVVIIPLFIAFVLPTFARRMRLVEGFVIIAAVLGLIGAGVLASLVLAQGGTPIDYKMGGWPAPWGIELKAGSLSALFLLVITGVGLPVTLFARGNLSSEIGGKERVTRFYVLYLLLGGAMAGMALTNDMFNVYVLIEVATLSCCGLVSSRNHPKAAKAAFTYLILATLGSGLILGGIGLLYIVTGHLNMGFVSQELGRIWQNSPNVVWMALSFLLVGFGVKSALFPLHVWLPDAHSSAPTPASAVLSGLAVKGYLILFMKFLYGVFGTTLMQEFAIQKILVLMGSVAIIAGSILALIQDNLKRRLAFSTVAQIGYLFLGMGLMNARALKGALFYLVGHAIIKSALFMTAGTIIKATGKERISELAGIGKKMPVTMAIFTIASLGLTGIPLFSGFIGKWHLISGGFEAGSILPLIVITAGSVLCAAYLFPVIRTAYFEPAPEGNFQDPGISQKAAFIILAAMIVVLGVLPGPILGLAGRAAAEFIHFH